MQTLGDIDSRLDGTHSAVVSNLMGEPQTPFTSSIV